MTTTIFRPPLVFRTAGARPGVTLLTYTYLALALTVAPVAQNDWPVPRGPRSAVGLSFTDSFKLPLTTVKAPYTEYNWPNPRGPRPLVLDWTDSFKLPLTTVVGFHQTEWPVPQGAIRTIPLSWADSFKLLLTTVAAPNSEHLWPNPRGPVFSVEFLSWLQSGSTEVAAPLPFNQASWPNPGRGAQPVALNWADAFKLPLTTVAPPYTQYDWPNPYPLRRAIDLGNFTSSGCSILRGPVYPATITFDYPNPRGRQPLTVEWSDKFKLPLTTVRAPYLQCDWPVPKGPRPVVDFGFVRAASPLTQPQTGIPIPQLDWPMPRGKAPLTVEWRDSFKLPLRTVKPPFTQYDWPLTRVRPELSTLRTWAGRFSLTLTSVRPPSQQYDWVVPKAKRPSPVGFEHRFMPLFGLATLSAFEYQIEGTSDVTFYSAYIIKPDVNAPSEVTLIDVGGTEVATTALLYSTGCGFQEDAFQFDCFQICQANEEIVEDVNLIQDPST